MKTSRSCGFAAMLLISASLLPFAARADSEPAPVVVVTATRSAKPLADVPASVSLISRRDIENTPARTIDEVLRRVPSIDLPFAGNNEQHPTDTIVSMRGLSGIRMLVLLDGMPLNDPFFGYVQWSEVPLQTVDRVEVVRGGGAPLWGNYAMGGVVNILTQPADKSGAVFNVAAGSRDTWRADAHLALAGHGYGIGLDAGRSHSNGYVEQVEGAWGAITVPTGFTADTITLFGNAGLTPDLTVRGRVSDYDNAQNFLTRLNTNSQRNRRYTGALSWKPGEGQALDLTLFHTDERFVTNNTGTPDGAGANNAEYVQNSHLTRASDWGTSLVWTRTFTGTLRALSFGIDYHDIRGSDTARIFDEAGTPYRTDTGAGNQRFQGAFAQAELRPSAPLQILMSVRYQEVYSFHGLDDTPGGLGRNVPDRHDRDVDPRLSVRYQLAEGLAVRGAVYRAFRAPTLDNLYRGASVPGYILYGNAALSPETLEGLEGGFDFARGSVRLQVTAYGSRIADFLTYRYLDPASLPAGFDVGARLINAGRATSQGVEGELSWRPLATLTATLGYTYADTKVTANPEDPASVGVQEPGIPRHRLSAGLDWTGPWGITLSPRIRYVARTNGDTDALFRTEAHIIADLGLSAPLARGAQGYIQIENLFNRRYIGTNDGFTAPLYGKPFTAVAGVRITLD